MKRAITILVILAMFGGLGWKVYQKLSATKKLDAKKAVATVAVEVAPVRQATIHDVAPGDDHGPATAQGHGTRPANGAGVSPGALADELPVSPGEAAGEDSTKAAGQGLSEGTA